MNNPLISIIIPIFNRAKLISETLNSILEQSYSNWECIIVDDGSTDNTKEVVQRYLNKDTRFLLFHRPNEYKPGGNGARNYGFKVSKGEFIQWFDSDDIMFKDKLNLQVIALIDNPKVLYSICKCVVFTDNLNIYKGTLGFNSVNYVNLIVKKLVFQTATILWRREFLENKVLWDEELLKGQEWNLQVRLFIKNFNFIKVNKVLCAYRQHDNSIVNIAKTDLRITSSYLKNLNKIYVFLNNNYKISAKIKTFFVKEIKNLLVQNEKFNWPLADELLSFAKDLLGNSSYNYKIFRHRYNLFKKLNFGKNIIFKIKPWPIELFFMRMKKIIVGLLTDEYYRAKISNKFSLKK